MATIEVTSLEQFLQAQVHLRETSKIKSPYAYVCMEDFVLQHGTAFTEISPDQPVFGHKGNRYRPRGLKGCFHNSYCAAVASRGHLRYVEGFAESSFFPVHHAWNIDAEDRVVDTTWCYDSSRLPGVGGAYMGVIFPIEYVRKTRTPSNTSIIDQWEKGWPLLQQKFEGLAS